MRVTGIIAHLNNRKNAYITKLLKPYNISHGQAIVMNAISKQGKTTQEDIVKSMQVDKSAVTRILYSLEDKGLIIKSKSPFNKKCHDIIFTEKGRECFEIVNIALDETVDTLYQGFTKEEQELLEKMLLKMKGNLENE